LAIHFWNKREAIVAGLTIESQAFDVLRGPEFLRTFLSWGVCIVRVK